MFKISTLIAMLFTAVCSYGQIAGPTLVSTGTSTNYTSLVLSMDPSWHISPSQLMSDNGGNVDITWSAAGTYILTYFDGNTIAGTLSITVSGGGSSGSGFWTDDTNGIYYNSGNVGIGINSHTSYRFRVSGDIHSTGTMRTNSHGTSSNWITAYNWGNHASVGYFKNGTSNLNVQSSGYLDDDDTYGETNDDWIRFRGYLEMRSNTDSYGIVLRNKDADDYLGITQKDGYSYFTDSHSSGNYFLRGNGANVDIRGDLNVYGGDIRETSGALKLSGEDDVVISVDYNNNDSDTRSIIFGKNDEGDQSNFSELMRIRENGLVGIGTDSPAEKLEINGALRGHVSGGAIRIRSSHGYVDIGPQNTSWSHFNTDRNRFYFNKGVTVNSGLIGSYDESLQLQTAGTTRLFVNSSTGNVGIGTTAPSSSHRLDVNGSIQATGGNSNNWNAAYTERGSQIAGAGLSWTNGKLNADAQNPALIITNTNQWNPDGSANTVFLYDDSNPTYNGKYVGAVIDIRGDGSQDNALVRTGAYHADHFQASRGFYVGSPETNGTRIIDASGNISTSGTVNGSNLNISNWNTSYTQRGSQIAGTGLNWSGGKLNVTGVNTDDQTIDIFSLSGSTLNLSIEGDGQSTRTVNLSSINTDNQNLSLSGNSLSLTNDATPVNLSSYLDNTDSQTLTIAGSNLAISGGNTIDISGVDTDTQLSDGDIAAMGYIKTETDNQNLSLSGNTLSLTNDPTGVDLTGYLDNTDDQDATEVAYTSASGLISTEVSGALDELNNRINSNDGSRWIENAGNISFSTGQVSIGTASAKPGYELSVGGAIVAEEVLIEFEGAWPDYVFDEKYDLMSISELKNHIETHNHLPNVPSAVEVSEEGVSLGKMNKILLEKIEELTLYMIDQAEEMQELRKKVQDLESAND